MTSNGALLYESPFVATNLKIMPASLVDSLVPAVNEKRDERSRIIPKLFVHCPPS